ncbi:MAG TPA: efflux RND transporter periplasmic adaptor subunit [Verrucomicrobiae bacterium]|nr:efflux RND transporter periplasmic adaptor subunit [Verrucomicrobiae bacterium]
MSPDKTTLDELRIDRAATPRRQSRRWLIGVALAFLLAGGAIVWWINRPEVMAVRTVAVRESSSSNVGGQKTLLNASGYVTARRLSTVSSKVSGKVMEVLVEEGMKVEAGQVLARLDSSNAEKSLELVMAQLESARKALDETKANLDRAESEVRRASQLAAEKLVTASELERVEAEAKSFKARLAKQTADITVAEHEVAVWRQQRDDTIIRAPFAGVVTSKNAQPGEMISPMSAGGFTRTGICTIVDMSSLEIEVDVSESYINRVEPGRPVEATLDSYPEWKIPAKVIAIIPTADRQKATVKVRVGFEKLDPRVLPDMGVKVAFQSGSQSAVEAPSDSGSIVVPKAAVRQRDGRDVVWVVRDGRVERRAVIVGVSRDDQVSIAAGLIGGERVVVEGLDNLADNIRVTETKR